MSRRMVVMCAIGVTTVLAVVAALAASLGDGSPEASMGGSGPYRGSEPPAEFELSQFELRNYDGRVVRSGDLRGGVTVLTFLDSQCTESCPVIAWTVARAIDSLTPAERTEVLAVAISTDPTEDTPRSVRSFLARNRAVGRLLYLGGGQPERELRELWNEFKVLSSLESGQDTLHSAPVRIYDRRGVWAATLHAGADLTKANLAHDIRVALALEGARDAFGRDPPAWRRSGLTKVTEARITSPGAGLAVSARGGAYAEADSGGPKPPASPSEVRARFCQSGYCPTHVGHVRALEPRTAGWSRSDPAGNSSRPHAAPESKPSACFRLQIAQWR